MKNIILLLFIFISTHSEAKKRALIIAVGAYPKESEWMQISSLNDVPLIKQSLLENGFLENDIQLLLNENATKKGIEDALSKLLSISLPGDIVVIHYSGHGQQIADDNGDEVDDKDEAIVPYDAYPYYSDTYKGEKHLRDDEIGKIINNFRNKLGPNGQLLILLDSCHSGSSTRGGRCRGGKPVFAPPGWKPKSNKEDSNEAFDGVVLSKTAAPFVIISGASADESNQEYQDHGSLSYSFSKAMSELGTNFTYRQLFSKISAIMNTIVPNQTPVIDGNVDYKLFKGEYVAQQSYFAINEIQNLKLIQINAGEFNGFFEGTTIFILPAGSSKMDPSKVLANGTITKTTINSALVKLDKDLPDSNTKKYWIFVDKYTYGDIHLKVFLDSSVTDEQVKKGIDSFLTEKKLGELVQNETDSEVIISKESEGYVLNSSKGMIPFDDVASNRGDEKEISIITEKLFNYAQGEYLKKLNLKNENYEFEFKLLPVEYDNATEKVGALLPEKSMINSRGLFQVNTNSSHVVLQVTNKGKVAIYFNIVEINSKGEIHSFMPNAAYDLKDDELKIPPGKTMILKDCVYTFGPPFEKLLLKGFATSTPLNFKPTIDSRGESLRRGDENPLESFMRESYVTTRDAKAKNTSNKVNGYTTEFVYEIIKQ